MASVCLSCGNILVSLIIILKILYVVSESDLYFHESDGGSHLLSKLDIVLLDDKDVQKSFQKRDVPEPPCIDHSVTNDTEISVSTSNTSTVIATPMVAPSIPITNVTVTTAKPTPTPIKKELVKSLSILERKKKVGVNGTGQRIDILPKSTSPPALILNNTLPITPNKTQSEDVIITTLPPFPSDIDTECGEKEFNKTLTNHNITVSEMDNYDYYNSTFYNQEDIARHYWVELDNHPDVKVNKLLSNSHRRAATVKLSFDFPFYGHLIKNVTIATGGFLYTGDYIHSWLAATQYIAPLMANFDTMLSNDSFIKYLDNGTAFTVEWREVSLHDNPLQGEFTFQVTLKDNGDIIFVYKNVPLLVKDIQEVNHPVKVGLSDAYILDRTVFLIRRKTIFEYHRVDFSERDIKNWTVIYLTALPTCLDSHDCMSCLTRNISSPTKCIWCPSLKKCSNGFDRHRQNWVAQDCDKKGLEREAECTQIATADVDLLNDLGSAEDFDSLEASQTYSRPVKKQQDNVGISGIMAILFLVAMISGLTVWVFYAYRNPHTTSGQILIRYRPSQWRWRRGEARYTAATIHM